MKGVQAYSTTRMILDAMNRLLILIFFWKWISQKKNSYFSVIVIDKRSWWVHCWKKRRAFITNDHQFNSYYSNRTRNTRVDGMIYKLYYWLSIRCCTCSIWYKKEWEKRMNSDKLIYMVTENTDNVNCLILIFLWNSLSNANLFLILFSMIPLLVRVTIFLIVHVLIKLDYTSMSFLFQV